MPQKIFRMALISCILITSLFIGGTALAQDEELPDPGITPDSPFYFFDTLGKNIGMFFTFGPEAKVRKALEYAEERLAEARNMAEKNRSRETIRAANGYDGFMLMVNQRAEEVKSQGVSDNISELVALATSRHLSVLDKIKDQASDNQSWQAVTRARTAAMNGQVNALRALAKNRLESALDISSDVINRQLQRARARATANITTDNVTADVAEALDYAARIAELEEEMTAIAQEMGIDITAVTQRLAHATSHRLEVLSGVYEKVPETARPAIENAIENSVRKYQRAVEKLKEENALGDVTENITALQNMPVAVQERLQLRTSSVLTNISGNVTVQMRVQKTVREPVSAP